MMASGNTDDLATLSEFEENSLMKELQARYNKDIIYVIEPCYTYSVYQKSDTLLVSQFLPLLGALYLLFLFTYTSFSLNT